MSETGIPRRSFLRGASAVSAATALSYSRVYGANERVQLGLIGGGERGRGDLGNFVKTGTVDLAAVCDIYAAQIDKVKQTAPNAQSFSDHRKLLELKEVDAVLIGVPDHWHAAIAIDALERRQRRVRGKAADAEDRGRAADRESGAGEQPHLPGGHAAALRQALPGGQARIHRHQQAGQDHAGADVVARQQLPSAQGAGVAGRAAVEPGLGALPGPAEVARLGSAAVLELARVSGFRRRPGDRPVHPLDRRGAHVHGAGHPDFGGGGGRRLPL